MVTSRWQPSVDGLRGRASGVAVDRAKSGRAHELKCHGANVPCVSCCADDWPMYA